MAIPTLSSGRRACLILLLASLLGCSEKTDIQTGISSDLVALKRLIKLPANVITGEWQSGKQVPNGNDWWLASVLKVDTNNIHLFLQGIPTKTLVDIPIELIFKSSFSQLDALPDIQKFSSNQNRLLTDTYNIKPYANSPLLNGHVVRISENEIFILMWTQ